MTGRRRAAILFVAPFLVLIAAVIAVAATQAIGGASPDRPPFAQEADGDYLRLRDEYIARLRGIETDRFANPLWRESAVETRFTEEKQRNQAAPNAAPAWTVIGPDSVPNGQALDGGDTAVSGRVTAIAVDPTNSNKVYLGTAQGGVWRSLNGGTTWTPIFDTAQSLSIGALAVAPSNPSVVYVGTGEAHNSTRQLLRRRCLPDRQRRHERDARRADQPADHVHLQPGGMHGHLHDKHFHRAQRQRDPRRPDQCGHDLRLDEQRRQRDGR